MPKLVVIVGQTASGKSGLAMKISKRYNGEIIAADSRTVWRGLDIGTAKPSKADQDEVRHHLLDVVGPGQTFNVSDFKSMASEAILDIQSRSRLPILVGGSPLYVDSVVYDYKFGSSPDQSFRNQMELLDIEALQAMIIAKDLELPENRLNKRYLIRVLERGHVTSHSRTLDSDIVYIGIRRPKDVLEDRIRRRLVMMLDEGLIDEVAWAHSNYPPGSEPLRGNIYRCLKSYIYDEKPLEECLEDFVRSDLRLAKKQVTWHKRDQNIVWFDNSDDAHAYLNNLLYSVGNE